MDLATAATISSPASSTSISSGGKLYSSGFFSSVSLTPISFAACSGLSDQNVLSLNRQYSPPQVQMSSQNMPA